MQVIVNIFLPFLVFVSHKPAMLRCKVTAIVAPLLLPVPLPLVEFAAATWSYQSFKEILGDKNARIGNSHSHEIL